MTNWNDYIVPDKYVMTGDGQDPFCAIQVDFLCFSRLHIHFVF